MSHQLANKAQQELIATLAAKRVWQEEASDFTNTVRDAIYEQVNGIRVLYAVEAVNAISFLKGQPEISPQTAKEMLAVILGSLTEEQAQEALEVWEEAGVGTVGSV